MTINQAPIGPTGHVILEVAEFTAIPGKAAAFAAGMQQGLTVLRRAEGCLAAQVAQAVEDDHQFILLVHWRQLADHLETFRNGPLFGEYRQHIAGLFIDQPRVRHYPVEA